MRHATKKRTEELRNPFNACCGVNQIEAAPLEFLGSQSDAL
jgi:hypothetical protein